ncbi:MAG: ABC transporter permease [Spirochaetia bacterium]|nr:ABC transporter permease [Spirochaetia bacterium]
MQKNRLSDFRWILFTSFKYFTAGRNKKIRFATLPIIGITAGFVAVIIIIGIMNGLQEGYLTDLIEINSYHARITLEPGTGTSAEKLIKELNRSAYVHNSYEFLELEGVIRSANGNLQPCLIKGLPSNIYIMDSGFSHELTISSGSFSIDSNDEIALGRNLAFTIGAAVGSVVELLALGEGKTVNFVPIEKQMIVTSKIGTGYPEIDDIICFVNISLLRRILPKTIPQIAVKLYDIDKINAFTKEAESIEGIKSVESWIDLNRSLYSALMLEKYSMFVILFLVFIVVSINIKSSLDRVVFSHKKDIGLMTAVGAAKKNLAIVFILQGIYIALIGIFLGLLIGILSALHINQIFLFIGSAIKTLTGYNALLLNYSFPVKIIPSELIIVSSGILFLSFFASWLAVRKILKFEPVRILHDE